MPRRRFHSQTNGDKNFSLFLTRLAVNENGRCIFPWEEAECEWTIIDDSDENEKRIVVKNNLREIFSEISITSASTTSTFGNPAPFLEF